MCLRRGHVFLLKKGTFAPIVGKYVWGYISCRSLSSNMINRQLIRIKVLQVLYNFYRVEGMTTDRALQVPDRALESSYRLYIYLCGLPMQISDLAEDAVEVEEGRFNKRPEILEVLKLLEG